MLVNGYEDKTDKYHYYSTARKVEHMCDKEGKCIKKYSRMKK